MIVASEKNKILQGDVLALLLKRVEEVCQRCLEAVEAEVKLQKIYINSNHPVTV